MPAISPDGKLLAYTTRRPKSPHYQIYVRALGDHGSFGKPLDTGSGEAFYPAWSPDGRTFAFLRCGTGPCEISTISVEGGAVHVVRSLPRFSLLDDRAYSCYMRMNPVWSPDGKSIIFPYRDIEGDSQRLVKHDLATDTEEVLTSGRQWDEDHSPSLSPDGKSVAFFRMNLTYADVMTVELGTHRQTTVAAHQPLPNNGLTWSPGRLGLVASLQEPGKPWALRWFPFSGTSREMPVALESPQEPTFSPDGKTLMALSVDSSHSLAWVDANRPTETHDLFGSHQIDLTVAFAPNGHGVALLSDRSGNTEIWLADVTAAGASNLRQLTHGLTQNTNFIAWSPSGKQLVLGNSKQRGTLWLVDANTGEIKLLRVPQLEKLLILSPVWAADEQSLYVAVSGDHSGIFRISLGEGLATEELVEDHVWLLQLDGDRALYYTRRSGTGVFRIDLKAPKPVSEPIPVFQKIRASLAWTLSDRALYFVDLYDVEQRLQRYDLLTKTVFDTRTQLSNVRFTGTLSRSAASQISIFSRWNSSSGSRLVTLRPQP
jgi:Tol biopolymer transport system component